MKDQKQEILEIIDGFKNLTYKIKKDNDEIKLRVKNKDEIIASCKSEYQKLYVEYKELESKYNELENYIFKQQEQEQEKEQEQQKKNNNNNNNNCKYNNYNNNNNNNNNCKCKGRKNKKENII